MTTVAAPICFGDVVKLNVKTGAGVSSLGFLEHKNDEFLLIVPPIKESANAKYQEAEFIIAPIRSDKPPALGTPLNYKQSFVLLTSSQFEDYSLNNKMNGNDTIGLQCRDVKGEMYLAIEKEGYTLEANVMDGDEGLDLVVVDSNRIRKQFNNKFGFYTKKSDVLGGYVSCGSKKNKPLSFSVSKVPGETTTKKFIQKQIPRRRRSTLTNDPTKADEATRRASRVGSDVSDGGALSPTANTSPAAAPAAVVAEIKPSSEPAVVAAPTTAVTPIGSPATASPASTATPAVTSASNQEPRVSIAGTTVSAPLTSDASMASPAPAPASAVPALSTAITPAATTTATPVATAPATPTASTPVTPAAAPVAEVLSEVSLGEKTPEKASAFMALALETTSTAASSTITAATTTIVTAPSAEATKPAAKEESGKASVSAAEVSSTTMMTPEAKSADAKSADSKTANAKPMDAKTADAKPVGAAASSSAGVGVLPQFVAPSPKKLGAQQTSALSVTSEAEGSEEKLDSSCIGGRECSIM